MASDPLEEKTRKWRRQLAVIYWGLSPALFPIFLYLATFPLDVARAFSEQGPEWARFIVLAYYAFAFVLAGVTLWFVWGKVREIPPPIDS